MNVLIRQLEKCREPQYLGGVLAAVKLEEVYASLPVEKKTTIAKGSVPKITQTIYIIKKSNGNIAIEFEVGEESDE